jgi:hypothetical protein
LQGSRTTHSLLLARPANLPRFAPHLMTSSLSSYPCARGSREGLRVVDRASKVRIGSQPLREFCVNQSCTVLHRPAFGEFSGITRGLSARGGAGNRPTIGLPDIGPVARVHGAVAGFGVLGFTNPQTNPNIFLFYPDIGRAVIYSLWPEPFTRLGSYTPGTGVTLVISSVSVPEAGTLTLLGLGLLGLGLTRRRAI